MVLVVVVDPALVLVVVVDPEFVVAAGLVVVVLVGTGCQDAEFWVTVLAAGLYLCPVGWIWLLKYMPRLRSVPFAVRP